MVRPTSISLEDQELEDLKLDAKAEGMNVSAYVRKLIRNRNTGTGEILPESGNSHQNPEPIEPPKKESTAEEIPRDVEEKESEAKENENMATEDEITVALTKRLQQMEFQKKIDTVCKDNECIKNDIKELNNKLDNKANCPECGLKVLTIGDSFCPACGQVIASWDELPGFVTYSKRRGR